MADIEFTDLSLDILLHIFKFCNINDLCRLKQTCTKFNSIIEYYLNSILTSPALVTNQQQSYILDRLVVILRTVIISLRNAHIIDLQFC